MIVTLRRLMVTERIRLGVVLAGLVAFQLLMVVVYDEVGDSVFAGLEGAGALARGFDIRHAITDDSVFANLIGVGFTHPLFLALLCTISVSLGARSCAGELHDGTIELTLAHPVRRTGFLLGYQLYMALAAAVALVLVTVTIPLAARALDTPGRIGLGAVAQTSAQAWLLIGALGGVAMLLSTWTSSRTAATLRATGVVVAMYFIEFFAKLWPDIAWLGRVSPFHYFAPTDTLQGAGMAWGDVAILAVMWIVPVVLALWQFQRRDVAP